jgi:hypothetical protein
MFDLRFSNRVLQDATIVSAVHEAVVVLLRSTRGSPLRRMRYKREGKSTKLDEIEQTWPKGERVRMAMDAVIAVELFGSLRARAQGGTSVTTTWLTSPDPRWGLSSSTISNDLTTARCEQAVR